MNATDALRDTWLQTRERLQATHLLGDDDAALSVRCPGATQMWIGSAAAPTPLLLDWREDAALEAAQRLHAQVYAQRGDVGAVAWSAGAFGHCLADVGGALPQVFDEQARHLGPMPPPVRAADAAAVLASGIDNAVLVARRPLCLGTSARRLALNIALFEKCAKAYVLAAATGGPTRQLPWWVRRIANGRLRKDQVRAAVAFANGALPTESTAY
ncbi:hypothetical protein ABFO19_22195 [Xanthomonas citri pv. glycines]|uniref:Ribulose-5-phosphate 4-epimerase/fuculose-1-phosphate aldolase n=1 Tax=Xanthomonas campestris pv. glycines TaxID=473421 RepID=A0AAX0HWB3_XANCG|nr:MULTISPECIES: hypothetical protein [Xanthomonas]AOY61137.1 hypothetical protein BHE84_02505 [Xanthomonas citri pv. glycines str. 8ra]ARV25308.1 hypothetical protein A9D66_22560 [Xanthomonas citri pv. glycines str. 12-2]EWC49038.1 hypothetical protein XAR_4572 [Xanthomonas citri pv. glycines str. 8ra]OEY88836.1 hypothetical protein BIY41_21740 [Xanthomonas citri pv. glycines]OOW98799.1 hypothetical protein Xgly_03775 [Xanthomonas citri pv. glycines]